MSGSGPSSARSRFTASLRAAGLSNLPDPVFAGEMVGQIISVHPHAFVVMDEHGHGVMTHLGIDTMQLDGEGFDPLVKKGDRVKRGQSAVKWNPAVVEAAGKSPISPVIALEATAEQLTGVTEPGQVVAGGALFIWN